MLNIFVLLSAILGVIWHAVVLKILWAWFFVPLFGLPALRLPEAVGVCVIVALLTPSYIKRSEDNREIVHRIFYMLFTPLLVLVMGWIAHLFM